MGLLNLGKKDAYGKQRRVEHRGRYLRASRTGGVALRAQAKAAGVSLTANTARGVCASVAPARNTQVALQNGRFILRGRYGKGPTKLNVSKSGATVSTRNWLGSFNWFKPSRSSAKLLGVQVRGKRAAQLQLLYMAVAAVVGAAQLLMALVVGLVRGVAGLAAWAWDGIRALQRRRRHARLRRRMQRVDPAVTEEIAAWRADRLSAALALAVAVWGRGEELDEGAPREQRRVAATEGLEAVPREPEVLAEAARELERCRKAVSRHGEVPWLLVGLLAGAASQRLEGERLPALLFEVDELALARGPRTVLQERMLEILVDQAGLQVEAAEAAPELEAQASEAGRQRAAQSRQPTAERGRIDLNTASLDELEAIPGIGPELAQAIVESRPIRRVDELEAIDGIGPQRLAEISAHVRAPESTKAAPGRAEQVG